MRPVLSREQMRAFDRFLISTAEIPSLVLMENAGRGVVDTLLQRFAGARSFLVVCGAGNNGGDGFVVARVLLAEGKQVQVALVAPSSELSGDARVNFRAYQGIGGAVLDASGSEAGTLSAAVAAADVCVDAIFGTGLSRAASGPFGRAIELLNEASAPVVAVDVPSGLHANSGQVLGRCCRATVTVTFAHPKLGLLTNSGADVCGDLVVAHIGAPGDLYREVGASAWWVEASDVAELLGRRQAPAHKGQAGHVAVIAGAPGMVGAARLAALGAFRGGAGLVTLCGEEQVVRQLEQTALEAMTHRIEPQQLERTTAWLQERASAVVLGPGLGATTFAGQLIEQVIADTDAPIVVDADALTHFRGRADKLAEARGPLILTPHPGEAAALLGLRAKDIEQDRFTALRQLVDKTHATVLLKGKRTLVGAVENLPAVNNSGDSVLATAGSGDVLAGLLAALACQFSPRDAALAAAWLHGRAGELWRGQSGCAHGMLAREIAELLPEATVSAAAEL